MSMQSSGRSMFFASMRRVANGTLAAPATVSLVFAPSQCASRPRGSMHTAVWRCTRKALATHVRRLDRPGVALGGRVLDGELALLASRGGRERLDLEIDRLERVLGLGERIGHHQRDRLADIAHLALRDYRLLELLQLGQRREAQGNRRYRLQGLRR